MNYLEMMKKYDSNDTVTSTFSCKELVQFFESNFWKNLVNEEISSLQKSDQWDNANMQLNYFNLRSALGNLLSAKGFPDFGALEDGFSPEDELEILKNFKETLNKE